MGGILAMVGGKLLGPVLILAVVSGVLLLAKNQLDARATAEANAAVAAIGEQNAAATALEAEKAVSELNAQHGRDLTAVSQAHQAALAAQSTLADEEAYLAAQPKADDGPIAPGPLRSLVRLRNDHASPAAPGAHQAGGDQGAGTVGAAVLPAPPAAPR